MKQKIRAIFFFFASRLLPELHYLKAIANGNIENSEVHPRTRLYVPYNIDECAIGEGTYIAINAKISRTQIGKYCSIGPNLICGWGIHPTNGLSTGPAFYSTRKQNGFSFSITDKIEERKSIVIGNDVFIGMNVTILDGVTIGDGAIIGAGAVVSKDIPPYAIAVGSPIQIKKYRFDNDEIQKLLKIKWWDFDQVKIKEVEEYFFDTAAFINKYYKNEK